MKFPQRTRGVYLCLLAALIAASSGSLVHAQQQDAAPGGFIESVVSSVTRPLTTLLTSLTLPSRGRFTFPAPYSTTGIRLTNAADCGGKDCVTSVGYAYWRNMNNHVGSNVILVALTLNRNNGGGGPTLFSYDKTSGETRNLGPLFDASSAFSWATGEGWYFSATMPTTLYVNSGSQILRYDVLAHTFSLVVDIASYAGSNRAVWQMHSSNDDAVHSFTVKDAASSADLGCGVFLEKTKQFRFFPARGEYDECQIDKSGRFLVIKENSDGINAEDNIVEDLQTGKEMFLADEAGALGHSDLGYGYGVGEDNWNAFPAAVRVWRYDAGGITDGRVVFHGTDWAFGDNHIAHSNARANLPLDQQIACSSSANRKALPHTNEIVCYRLDGSMNVLVVAPVMTDLNASGGGSDDYSKTPKGNLDVTGEYFLWTSNMGGARQDAFMVRVPLAKLGGSVPSSPATPPSDTTPPPPPPSTSLTAVAVTWIKQVNTALSGTTLTKARGCAGCGDAGASSSQTIASGDGYMEVLASETSRNRAVGLSNTDGGTAGEEIAFGLRLSNGIAEVRERGVYRADTRIAAGDHLRVQVVGGKVSYAKNDAVFYTSQTAPQYPLLVDSTFYDVGATLTDVVLASAGGASGGSPSNGSGSGSSGTTSAGGWINPVNAIVTSAGLQKTSGCDGCPDAGAVSAARLTSGSGLFQVAAGSGGLRFVGLGPSTALSNGINLPFAFRLSGSTAEVRESGVYVSETTVSSSDVLSIVVTGGRVQYAKNGVVFYTSAKPSSYPLIASASIYAAGAIVPTPSLQAR